MKLSLHLDHPGASLDIEAVAGQLLLQVVQAGRPPVTVILDADTAGQLVDFVGALATVAQEQAAELGQLVDRIAPPRDLAREGAAHAG
jgi:hypothetical protein